MSLTTEFHIYKDIRYLEDMVVIAIPKNNDLFQCWSAMNEIERITKFSDQLLTDPNFGWLTHSANLGPLVAIYTIQSHPEYFL